MSYQDFGLDDVKKPQDPGEKAICYDPWTWQHVSGRNFYLCFSNWVMSRTTIEAFLKQQPVDALPNDKCQKCMKVKDQLHYCIDGMEEKNRDLGICSECVGWAAEFMAVSKPSNNTPMDFFKQLNDLNLVGDLKMVITRTGPDALVVSLLLDNEKCKDDAARMIPPVLLSGTPDEMDAEFFATISKPLQRTSGLMVDMTAYTEQVDAAQKASKMETEKADKEKKEKEARKKAFDDAMKKVDELVKAKKFKEALAQLPKPNDHPNYAQAINAKHRELSAQVGQTSVFDMLEETNDEPEPEPETDAGSEDDDTDNSDDSEFDDNNDDDND